MSFNDAGGERFSNQCGENRHAGFFHKAYFISLWLTWGRYLPQKGNVRENTALVSSADLSFLKI